MNTQLAKLLCLGAAVSLTIFCSTTCHAQGGILIDAKGILSASRQLKRAEVLSQKKLAAAAKESLSTDLNRHVAMRLVSLPALEAECRRLLDAKQDLPDQIKYLGGLQRIDYVLVLPETKDVVIAGPADGFAKNNLGVMVGVESQRPVLRLDDLLDAIQSHQDTIGCSIDPDQGRLADVNRYLQQAGDAASVRAAKARYTQMAKILGLQNVRVFGVSDTSHFARVMVEADYRMKRISVGAEKSRVKSVDAYLQMKGAGTNTMRRWWFAPLYNPLQRSEDGTVWHLTGQRVQLMSQDEIVADNGSRSAANFRKASTEQFARMFTDKYEQLTNKSCIWAELQNLFDLAVTAALIEQHGMPAQVEWPMSLFADPDGIPTDDFQVPRHVPSLHATKQVGRDVVVGVVGGGVTINPKKVIRSLRVATVKSLAKTRAANPRPKDDQAKNRWWWDATENQQSLR